MVRDNLFLVTLMTMCLGTPLLALPKFYDMSEVASAQADAGAHHLPIAWIAGDPSDLSASTQEQGDEGELTRLAMTALDGIAVIIFVDDHKLIGVVPTIVEQPFHIHDDGEFADDVAWLRPKIVFSDPAITKILTRVSHKQLAADREIAINIALQTIHHDLTVLIPGTSSPRPSSPSPDLSNRSSVSSIFDILAFLDNEGFYLLSCFGFLLAIGIGLVIFRSKSKEV